MEASSCWVTLDLLYNSQYIEVILEIVHRGGGVLIVKPYKRHFFSAIKVFMEILPCCLGNKCSLFSTIKERCLYSQEKFHGTPENREKCKSLTQ